MADSLHLDSLAGRGVAVAQLLSSNRGMMLAAKPVEIVMSRTVRVWSKWVRGCVVMNAVAACMLMPMWATAGTAMTFTGAVNIAFLQCGCLCVEGVPQTLCSSVEEAQQRPSVCGQQQCPDYVAVEAMGSRYVSPHAFADNCRDVRVWDAAREAYDGIKVCDVLELPVAPTRR